MCVRYYLYGRSARRVSCVFHNVPFVWKNGMFQHVIASAAKQSQREASSRVPTGRGDLVLAPPSLRASQTLKLNNASFQHKRLIFEVLGLGNPQSAIDNLFSRHCERVFERGNLKSALRNSSWIVNLKSSIHNLFSNHQSSILNLFSLFSLASAEMLA